MGPGRLVGHQGLRHFAVLSGGRPTAGVESGSGTIRRAGAGSESQARADAVPYGLVRFFGTYTGNPEKWSVILLKEDLVGLPVCAKHFKMFIIKKGTSSEQALGRGDFINRKIDREAGPGNVPKQ
jgi:hypothetical protein